MSVPFQYVYTLFIYSLILFVSFTHSYAQHFELSSDFPNHTHTYGMDTLFGAGGISFMDFNQDGWDDLTFSTTDGDSILFFINNNGSFEKIPSLIDHHEDARQILWVDYDNDGDLDLFISTFLGANRLYENDGNLNLTDASFSLGLGVIQDISMGAAFGDIDNDGDLDLYVSNHAIGPFNENMTTNFLYENQGDIFLNITTLANAGDSLKFSFCSTIADYNNDGFQDIYIINDRSIFENTLLINQGNNTFLDMSIPSNSNVAIDAMNAGVADYDYDSDLDIYITNIFGNVFLENNGDGSFTDIASELGVRHNKKSWGGNFLDIDNDTDMDLFVSSGEISPNAVIGDTSFYYLMDNDVFQRYPLPLWDSINSYCNAYGDYNNDGKLDVAISSNNPHHFVLWENISPEDSNHWIKIKLKGTTSNLQGIGSWIDVYAGGTYMNRYTFCGEAFLAQNSDKIHFGLGYHETIDSIKIRWPSGIIDSYFDVNSNQILYAEEGETNETNHQQHLASEYSIHLLANPGKVLSFKMDVEQNINFTYQLINTKGIIHQKNSIGNYNGSIIQLEDSSLNEGLYYLKIEFEDGSFLIKKWVLKR